MKKNILISTVAALVAFSAVAAAQDHWIKMRIDSNDGHKFYKRIRNGGARLIRKHSDAPCIREKSWGVNHEGVWVDHGCRATFEIKVR